MKRERTRYGVGVAIAALALALAACDDGSNADGDGRDLPTVDLGTPSDVTPGPDNVVPHTLTSSAKYGWSLPTTPPAVNPECAEPDETVYGPSVPWLGFTHDGTTYTCNKCPGGRKSWQGRFRAVYDPDDPEAPFEPDETYRERLEVEGNRIFMDIVGEDLGQTVAARVEGWTFCGQKPEVPNETSFVVITHVDPPGAFGWDVGLVFTADILTSDFGGLLFAYYEDVELQSGQPWFGTQPYCRIGLEVGGAPCDDPFE